MTKERKRGVRKHAAIVKEHVRVGDMRERGKEEKRKTARERKRGKEEDSEREADRER